MILFCPVLWVLPRASCWGGSRRIAPTVVAGGPALTPASCHAKREGRAEGAHPSFLAGFDLLSSQQLLHAFRPNCTLPGKGEGSAWLPRGVHAARRLTLPARTGGSFRCWGTRAVVGPGGLWGAGSCCLKDFSSLLAWSSWRVPSGHLLALPSGLCFKMVAHALVLYLQALLLSLSGEELAVLQHDDPHPLVRYVDTHALNSQAWLSIFFPDNNPWCCTCFRFR